MKKALFFPVLLLFPLLFVSRAAAVELNVVKPMPPFGVFSSFSAQSLKKGDLLIGLNIERAKGPAFYRHVLGASYGLTNRFELTLNVPFMDEIDGKGGFEDIGAALKYRFLDEGKYGPSAALIAMGFVPSGRDEFSRGGGVGGGLAVSRKIGPFMGHLNGLFIKSGDSALRNEWDVIAGVDFSASHSHKMLAEFLMRKGPFSSKVDQSEVRLGYRFFGETLSNTIGVGFDLKDRTPQYRIIFSISAYFAKGRAGR